MEPTRSYLNPRTWLALAQREIAPIAGVLGITLLLFAFVEIADDVGEGDTHAFDERFLLALRTGDPADPIGPL